MEVGERLLRIYDPRRGDGLGWRSFGPLTRFDHHRLPQGADPDRTVWYAARSLIGTVAEAFGGLGVLARDGGRRLAVARVLEPLPLIDLVGSGARAFGLDQQIATTTDYATTQAWARCWYEHYPGVVGLRWRGRQSGSICVVLHDRGARGVLALLADHELGAPAIWPRVARAARRCRIAIL